MHFDKLKLFFGNLEKPQEEENVNKKGNVDGAVVKYRPVREHNTERNTTGDSDSESVVDYTIRRQASAQRPSSSVESESASAHRPDPGREYRVAKSLLNRQRPQTL